ncbi:MAG: protein kinase [Gordonia sp. (in: high G+C Gram-positive bacteria)]
MYNIGDEIAGYRVLEVLGTGGMGEVYRAQHPRLPRADAIKILRSAHAGDPIVRTRFEREADLLAPLSHPNLVRVYDRGVVDDQLWIAMELVPGTDASDLVKASPGGVDPRLAVSIVEGVGAALDVAHRHGILHRDIKPANILITPGDDPIVPEAIKVTDFGIAQALGDASAGLTGTGTTVGTMRYCSPEQIEGVGVDGRSDVYSLAATAFELLTGGAPFEADTIQGLMTNHLFTDPPYASQRNRALPRAVDDVLRAGMAKNKEARPQTARGFAQALRAAFEGRPVNFNAPPSGPHQRPMGATFGQTPQPFMHQGPQGGQPTGPVTGPMGGPGQMSVPMSGPMTGPNFSQHGPSTGPPPRQAPWYRRLGGVGVIGVVVALLLGIGGGMIWNAADTLPTPGTPDAKFTPKGVELSWSAVDGADEYVVKQNDDVIYSGSDTTFVAMPFPGTYRYSVAAAGTKAPQSAYSGQTGDVKVTQTWRDLFDIAQMYPNLIPTTPVSTDGYDGVACQGTGPYGDRSDRRSIFCNKRKGESLVQDVAYSIAIYAYPDRTKAGGDAIRQAPTGSKTDDDFKTAQGHEGWLRSGTDSDGNAVAIFNYFSSDIPQARTVVTVTIPGNKDPQAAISRFAKLPI